MSLGNLAKSIMGISAICVALGLTGCATQKSFYGGNGYDAISVASPNAQAVVPAGYANSSAVAQPASVPAGSWTSPRQSIPQKRRSDSSSCFS